MNPYEYDPEQTDSVNPEVARRFYDTATNMAIQPGAAPASAPAPDARWMLGALAAQDRYRPAGEGAFLPDVGAPAIGSGGQFSAGLPAVNAHLQMMYDKDRATLGNVGSGAMGALADLATLPRRAIQNSQFATETGTYDPAVPVEAALNLAGTGLPFAQKGAAGVFGGRLAQGADLNALKLAEDMAGRNASQYKIRQATGWFQGPDAKWRFEIPDTTSKWKVDPTKHPDASYASHWVGGPVPLDSMFEHPELFAAYPQLAKADFAANPNMGGTARGMYQAGGAGSSPTLTIAARDPASMRSSALHEMQHGIQDIEGFATGGNTFGLTTKSPGWDLYQERLKAITTPSTEKYLTESGVLGPEYSYADYLKEHQKIIRDPERMRTLDRAAQDYAVQEGYKRLAGEVEARNVQTRADWTPGRLKNVPPWSETSQDVPYNKQFIKYPRSNIVEQPQLSRDVPAAPEMGFGSTPQGTFKNWLLRYDPETGAPAFVNKSGDTGHAFSTLKTGAKPADMTFQIANDPGYTLPSLDIAKLQKEKAELVFGPTDRLRGGGEVTHVGGQQLATPVPQEGGYNFTPKNAGVAIPGMPGDVDPLYAATTRTAAKVPQERATDILNRGGVPYYVPVAMTHGAGDSAKQMANTVHQLVRQAEPNADAIAKINASIAAKGGNAPDFANREAFQQWLDSGLPARTAFTKGIDTKEILKATGVDVGQARLANTMPELYHTPSGSAGLLVGRMRPDVGVTEHPLHSNYPITWMGQKGEAYRAPGSLPFSLLSPDMHRGLVPKVNQGVSAATTPAIQVMRGLPKDIPQVQPVTQEVVDNYYEWFRRHPSGWMAAGAAPLGALAATGDYQPEEKM